MNVSSASLQNNLIDMATQMKLEDFQREWSTSDMKQVQGLQKVQAEGLLKMIRNGPGLNRSGQITDLQA